MVYVDAAGLDAGLDLHDCLSFRLGCRSQRTGLPVVMGYVLLFFPLVLLLASTENLSEIFTEFPLFWPNCTDVAWRPPSERTTCHTSRLVFAHRVRSCSFHKQLGLVIEEL